jgi:hypothetical protein
MLQDRVLSSTAAVFGPVSYLETRSSGKNQFAYFPYISHLFEVLEPNFMELNLL